jgi:hypothetical protein
VVFSSGFGDFTPSFVKAFYALRFSKVMSDPNPYAPPESEIIASTSRAIVRDGKYLAIGRNAVFPRRCVKCNAPTTRSCFVYLSRKENIHVGICERHERSKVRREFFQILFFKAAILVMFVSSLLDVDPSNSSLMVLVPMVSILIIARGGVRVARKNESMVWLNGIGREFLESFPSSKETLTQPLVEEPMLPSHEEKLGEPAGAVWRQGDIVGCDREAVFPRRCVMCNDAADEPFMQELVCPPFFMTQRAMIRVRLCKPHVQKLERQKKIRGMAGHAVSALLMVRIFELNSSAVWYCPALLLAYMIVFRRVGLQAVKIEDAKLWIKGCGKPFLDSLPASPQI